MTTNNNSGHSHESFIFPKGFLWGTATSAHQVEGGNVNSDWYAWEQVKGNIAHGHKSGRAANHYELFEQDFDLVKRLNQNAHRLSIEWSRLEPREGEWDKETIEHYRKVFKALKQRNIKIMLTLNHFTLPYWVAMEGGWKKTKNIKLFNRFVVKVVEEFGEYIDWWITINEPMVYIGMSYTSGAWPPQKKSYYYSLKVFINLVRAHRAAYRVIHRHLGQKACVGYANNVFSLMSYQTSFLDYLYMRVIDMAWNHSVYFFSRKYHDFIAVNYYFHQRFERREGKLWPTPVDTQKEQREHSDMGWEIYPHGLFEIIKHLNKYKLPIYIAENGIAALNDDKRVRFIIEHVREVYHAIQSGADVRGYFYWSLIDNFEWDKGFYPRFGMVGVDYKTYERNPHKSALVYAKLTKQNGIVHDDLVYLGHHITNKDEKITRQAGQK